MKTSEQRDAVVKLVQATHKKWPSFDKMPKATETEDLIVQEIDGDPSDNTDYVAALYELCAKGAVPVGNRILGEGKQLSYYVIGKMPKPA